MLYSAGVLTSIIIGEGPWSDIANEKIDNKIIVSNIAFIFAPVKLML